MKQKKFIPIAFNMSLGLIPIIICMILLDFVKAHYALSVSTALGLLFSIGSYLVSKKKIYNFIAYIATGVLITMSAIVVISPSAVPVNFMPFTLATMMLVCTGGLFYGQKHLKRMCSGVKDPKRFDLLRKSMKSSIVSARLIFIVGVIHFILIAIILIFATPLRSTTFYVLFHVLPILLLSIAIGINQLSINFANNLMKDEVEVPIVNEAGDIVGKRYKLEALYYKNKYINPVIRIAYIHDGMLFLCNRHSENIIDANKIDLPLETYLELGEELYQGVERLVYKAYRGETGLQPRFSLKYIFEAEDTHRLIYLYIAYIEDENLLNTPYFQQGKLWTFQQIEMNLNKNYFGRQFEHEYDYLKETVKVWEEFK